MHIVPVMVTKGLIFYTIMGVIVTWSQTVSSQMNGGLDFTDWILGFGLSGP